MTAKFERVWDARLSEDTFDCPPIGDFVRKYLSLSKISVDPFSRNKRWATYTNDLNPKTESEYHLDAVAFLDMLEEKGVVVDLMIFDPPYSPRQISEMYKEAGIPVTMKDTQNARLYKEVRDAGDRIIEAGGIVLSFGWNSVGMGVTRGYEIIDGILVAHGAAHNDTICMAERKMAHQDSMRF